MCLIVKEDQTPGLSDYDITVYKLGYTKNWPIKARNPSFPKGDSYFSPIYKTTFVYELNVIQTKVELVLKSEDTNAEPRYFIEEGYHAFITLDNDIIEYARQMSRLIGLHPKVGKFTIPAHIPYFLEGNEIVASTIIYKGLLK
jgi:hypothetical protein